MMVKIGDGCWYVKIALKHEPVLTEASQWWSAIWIGIALIYCFLLMEGKFIQTPLFDCQTDNPQETNYNRSHINTHASIVELSRASDGSLAPPTEKENIELPTFVDSSSEIEASQRYSRKSYWQKLSLIDKKRPNRMLDVFIAPFKGFTYPCIVYAGLMYGANALVWSGVQNVGDLK